MRKDIRVCVYMVLFALRVPNVIVCAVLLSCFTVPNKANLLYYVKYREWMKHWMNFHRFNLQIYDMQCLLYIVVNWFCVCKFTTQDKNYVLTFRGVVRLQCSNSSLRRHLLRYINCAIAVKSNNSRRNKISVDFHENRLCQAAYWH